VTVVAVPMGEAAAGGPGDVLAIYGLGSCVALAVWDPETRRGVLCHIVLPGGIGMIDVQLLKQLNKVRLVRGQNHLSGTLLNVHHSAGFIRRNFRLGLVLRRNRDQIARFQPGLIGAFL